MNEGLASPSPVPLVAMKNADIEITATQLSRIGREKRAELHELTLEPAEHRAIVRRKARRVNAVPHERLRQKCEVEGVRNADPHVVLFAEVDGLVEESDLLKARPTEHDGRRRTDAVVLAELVQDVPALAGPDRHPGLPRRPIDHLKARVHGTGREGRLVEDFQLTGELLRKPFVVVVQKGHEIPDRIEHAGISRRADPPVRLVSDVSDARVLEGTDDGLGVVARIVIHDDDLEVLVRLTENAPNGRSEELRPAVRGNDDADSGHDHFREAPTDASPPGPRYSVSHFNRGRTTPSMCHPTSPRAESPSIVSTT